MSHNTCTITIPILAANPRNTSRLWLDEEVREITAALKRAKNRSGFEIVSGCATRVKDLHRALLEYQLTIVYFSGHGNDSNGLALKNNFGQVQLVGTKPLARLFGFFQDTIECVLVTVCYSLAQEVNKLKPDKNEVGKALDRAFDYPSRSEGFAPLVEKFEPHSTKTVSGLGENWHKLLSIVGLTL